MTTVAPGRFPPKRAQSRPPRAPTAPTSLLEQLVTHPDAFALTTATPVQRAICRCLDGVALGELADDPDVQWAFSGTWGQPALDAIAKLPVGVLPKEVILCAAIRGAKTLISSALAFKACLTVDLSLTRRNETVRYSVTATDMEKATVALEHLKGTIPEAPLLRPYFLRSTKSGVVIRHPSGRPIEIRVVVAGGQGRGVIARWSAGLTADEAARMQGDGKSANLPELLRAIKGRVLPGGQVFMPGAPWAPMGPIYNAVTDKHGKPSRELVVIRARGPMLNPMLWTKEAIEELRAGADGELIVQTDVMAEFGSMPTAFFTTEDIARATREQLELPYDPQKLWVAFMDPANRGNAWTLVIASCTPGNLESDALFEIACVFERIGTKLEPLKSREVFSEMLPILEKYHLDEVWTDQHNFDPNKEIAEDLGITLLKDERTTAEKDDGFLALRGLVVADAPTGSTQVKRLSLPPDVTFRADMLGIVKKLTRTGYDFPLPITSDGRHCDYAPSVTGAIAKLTGGTGDWATAVKRIVRSAAVAVTDRDVAARTLREAREKAGLTLAQLAERSGRDAYSLALAESGQMSASSFMLKDVLKACGLSEDWRPAAVLAAPPKELEVELHSTEPSNVEATRQAIEGLPHGYLLERGGRFFVPDGLVSWAVERQGYVKRVIRPT